MTDDTVNGRAVDDFTVEMETRGPNPILLQDLTLLLDHCGPGSPFAKADRVALRQFAKDDQSRQRSHDQRAASPYSGSSTGVTAATRTEAFG